MPLIWLLATLSAAAVTPAEKAVLVGDLNQAMPLAQAAAERDLEDAAAQELFIDILVSLGAHEWAERTYVERAVASPGSAVAHYLAGRATIDVEQARAAYQKALELDPEQARARMGLAALARAEADLATAERLYSEALERDRTLSEAWAGLGATYLGQGRFAEALATARQGMQQVPDEADAYLAVAGMAPDEAPIVLAAAVRNVPWDPRVHAAFAHLQLERGKADAALSSARRALELAPQQADALLAELFAEAILAGTLDAAGYLALADARELEREAPEQAELSYDELVERYPSCALPRMSRSRLRLSAGDAAGALQDLEEAVRLDPDNAEARAARGLLNSELGRYAEARQDLEVALEARPGNLQLALAASMAQARTDGAAAALPRLRRLAAQHPSNLEVLLTTATVLSESGDPEGAYRMLKDALPRVPDGRLALALAAAAKDAGHFEEAARIVEEIGRRLNEPRLLRLATSLREQAAQ